MKIFLYLVLSMSLSGYFFYNKLKKYCSRVSYAKTQVFQKKYHTKFIKEFNAKSFKIITKDNLSLDTFVIKRKDAKKTILMVHGYRQSKEYLYKLVKLFDQDNIVLIDLRAHGLSSGELISWGYYESEDVKAAVDFIKLNDNLNNVPIVAIGCSLGSVAVLKAASEGLDIKAIVLDSGFADLEEHLRYMVNKKFKVFSKVFPIIKYSFNKILDGAVDKLKPYKLISNIKIPVFILHSKSDIIIPVSSAYKLYKNINNNNFKDVWIVEDSQHIKIFKDYKQEYKSKITSFFSKALEKN